MRINKVASKRKSSKPLHIEEVVQPARIRTLSFAQAYPEAAVLWDYKKNCGFGPEDFSYASSVLAWFSCPKGKDHKFQTNIASMTKAAKTESQTNGCGFCRGLKASVTNSVADKYPHLVSEWMVTKNRIRPDQVSYGSNKKVWWKCNCGHTWQATISHRTNSESGCPRCNAGSATDLRDFPNTLAEFDYKKNKGIDPYALATDGIYHWRCSVVPTHTWVSRFSRTTKNARCPYCTNRKGSRENNLKKSHPSLAKQWHPTKNHDRKPTDFTSGSQYKAWWSCPKGPDHEWEARIYARATRNSGCPFCSLRRTSITNVLSTVVPKLANEWHPTKNGKAKPNSERIHSTTKRWWLCPNCSHEWELEPQKRVIQGKGCPQCAKTNS
ncbi:MAG: zinc-ribbon domain-containing protein [Candidatus Obscuribacterales bacterium]|jgi:hypothetical protein